MSFFSIKEKVELEIFTNSYFDKYLPYEEPNLEFFRILKNQLDYVDKSFSSIDFDIFLNQIAAIKLECFGLAFFYRFGEKLSVENSIITKKYLYNRDLLIVWELQKSYNSIVAKSATDTLDPSSIKGRATISFVVSMRTEHFKEYHSKGFDDVCVARALNRFLTNIDLSIQYLVLNFSQVLDYEFNDKARGILHSRISEFYTSCMYDLKKIKIVG